MKNKIKVNGSRIIYDNGIGYEFRDDGTIIANGGTANHDSIIFIYGASAKFDGMIPFEAGEYIFTGCPEFGDNNVFACISVSSYEGNIDIYNDTGNGAIVKVPENARIAISIIIRKGLKHVDNIKFKPMLRLSDEEDDTFEPYETVSSGGSGSTNPNPNASDVKYNGSSVGIKSSTVQGAITEVAKKVDNKVEKEDGKSLLANTDKEKYDAAEKKAHTHTNEASLDKIGEDNDGNLIYAGEKIKGEIPKSSDITYDNTASKLKSITAQAAIDEVNTKVENKVEKENGKSLLSDADKEKYDAAQEKAHTHSNESSLDKIGEDSEGNLTYDGKKIEGGSSETVPTSASGISYSNKSSKLSATDVQAAIDEVNSEKVSKEEGKSLLADTDKEKYDAAQEKAHTHANELSLNKIGEDSNGNLTYNGSAVGSDSSYTDDEIESAVKKVLGIE